MEGALPEDATYPELTSARSIRLLGFVANPEGEVQDSIHLHVESVDLDAKPSYKALSYTWGNPLPFPLDGLPPVITEALTSNQVFCNGKERAAIPNLYSALLRLRSSFPRRMFWIDWICINQDDVAERNSQVSLMGEIYSSASEVVVWLG